jgi:dUTPase
MRVSFSAYDYTVPSGQIIVIETDLCFEIPSGYYGQIAGRSSMALKRLVVTVRIIFNHIFSTFYVVQHLFFIGRCYRF